MTIYGIIYVVTNSVNGKQYVGQTTLSVSARWGLHRSQSKHGDRRGFHGALVKYGHANFTIKVVAEGLSKLDLDEKEKHWISHLGSRAPTGYNLMEGGRSAGKHSQETIERMRLAHTGKVASDDSRQNMSRAQKGRPVSDTTRELMRRNQTGKKASQETKLKMSLARKGKPRDLDLVAKSAATRKGTKCSPEACARIREGCKKRVYTPESIEKRNSAIRAAYQARKIVNAEKEVVDAKSS